MKKRAFFIAIAIILIILVLFIRTNGDKNNLVKDLNEIYTKHGNSVSNSDYVKTQQELILCSRELYQKARASGMKFNSQCLGKCQDYSVDIVNVPRTEEDNKEENQCSDYKTGITKNFIELDKNGNIVRVAE